MGIAAFARWGCQSRTAIGGDQARERSNNRSIKRNPERANPCSTALRTQHTLHENANARKSASHRHGARCTRA